MSRSGVAVSDEVVEKYNELKLAKKLTYVIYGLNATRSEVVVIKDSSQDGITDTSDSSAVYEVFLTNLPEGDCRYAVYDFSYEKSAQDGKRNKICFIAWSPDDAPVKSKMVYASSKDAIRRALTGLAVEIQGTDFSEVAYETILEKVSKGR